MRTERASENARLQQASLGPRQADGASKQPVAQRNGDRRRVQWAYARRSPVPERACPTRPRRRVASTNPDARRRHRSIGWCRTTCIACRRSTTSDSPASTARGVRWSATWPTGSLPVVCWNTASPASGATPARTSVCSRSRVRAGTSAPVATPSGWPSGPGGWTPRSSRPFRTARWCSPSPSGCAPTVSTAADCSARSPASPRALSQPLFVR